MEALALEISKYLGITFDMAIDMLPVIQSEFVIYKILSEIEWMLMLPLSISLIILIIGVAIESMRLIVGETTSTNMKLILKWSGLVAGLSALILFIMRVIQYVYSPTISLLLEFIK